MSSNVWFTADTHFNHRRLIEINRPQFCSVEEMNETMIERWNERVEKGDRVYHDDVAAKMATKRFEPVDHHIDELD